MKEATLRDLILQSLEHEIGGVEVYETALRCVANTQLQQEWKRYLEQTRTHVEILRTVCAAWDLDPEKEVPSREVVQTVGRAVVLPVKRTVQNWRFRRFLTAAGTVTVVSVQGSGAVVPRCKFASSRR